MIGKFFIKGYVFLYFILMVSLISAQSQLLEKEFSSIRNKYFVQNNVKLDIEAIQIDNDDTSSVERCLLYINRNKFRIDFPDQVIICNGKYLYTYTYNDSQLVVENFDTTSALRLVHDIFIGSYRNFRLLSIEEMKHNRVLNLSYRYGELYFKDIKVLIDEGSSEIREISYIDIEHVRYVMKIYKTQFTNVPEDLFDTKNLFIKTLVDLRG